MRSHTAGHIGGSGKKTGQIYRREKSSISDLELDSLAGFFELIWSILCTRYIPDKLTPRGHHDWPDIMRPSDLTPNSHDQSRATACLASSMATRSGCVIPSIWRSAA